MKKLIVILGLLLIVAGCGNDPSMTVGGYKVTPPDGFKHKDNCYYTDKGCQGENRWGQ